jgi:hypothetical protein
VIDDQARLAVVVLWSVAVLGSGVWLTAKRRPYGAILLTLHKLAAVAGVVAIAVQQAHNVAVMEAPYPLIWLLLFIIALAAVGTGAILTASRPPLSGVLWFHRVAAWVVGPAMALIAFLAVGQG